MTLQCILNVIEVVVFGSNVTRGVTTEVIGVGTFGRCALAAP